MELDLQTLITVINQTAFPIAACIVLFWLVNKTLKAQQEILNEVKTAIQNNTHAIEEVSKQIKWN